MEFNHEKIDANFILERITERDIFTRYLNIVPDLHKHYRNPLRVDEYPSCRFYVNPLGTLKFKDFSTGQNIDCFNVVQLLYGVNFYTACEIIANDFRLANFSIDKINSFPYKERNEFSKRDTVIQVKRRPFTRSDMDFWGPYFTKQYLEKAGVAAVEYAWINKNIAYRHKKDDPCYVYYFGMGKYKLYYPFRLFARFIQNDPTVIQGLSLLPKFGENLVITKSYKDVLAINLFSETHNIWAIAPMSETTWIKEEVFSDLYNRFDNIVSLMDRDRSGVAMSKKLKKEYSIPAILFGSEDKKDFFANLLEYGVEEMGERIEYVKSLYL